jgi:hypothetical protein
MAGRFLPTHLAGHPWHVIDDFIFDAVFAWRLRSIEGAVSA